ncbi:MAG: tetratricopeptide repeat protein [Bacteroidota bacterium]
MINTLKISLFVLMNCFALTIQAQNKNIDSLNLLLEKGPELIKKAYVLDELSYEWFSQDLDSSLIYGLQSWELFETTTNSKGKSQSATSVAVAYHYLNQWDNAEHFYRLALKIRKESQDTLKTASSLNNLGVMFMDKKEYDSATHYFIEAMGIHELTGNELKSAITKTNLGLIFKKQGNYDKALEFYKEAKTILESYEKYAFIEIALLNLGSISNVMGNFEEALKYNQQLLNLTESRSSTRNLAKCYVNLSNSYDGLNKPDSSLLYVRKALDFFEQKQDTLNIANSLLSLSQFHFEQAEYAKALKVGQRLEELNRSLNNAELTLDNQLLFSKAFEKLGDYESAYKALNKAYSAKDSLLTSSLNEAITDLSIKYETEQKERQISELQIKNQKTIIEQQKSLNQRNILFLIAGILIIGTVLLILLVRTKSKANKEISKALSEKEILLKEIHHRVKNNLQIISSLLSLQSRYIENEKAKEAVDEGQNRVKSMALIHQKLYQNDNLSGVNALDYIQNLTSTLKASYKVSEDEVEINYNIEPLNIDVDTIIPIGLILNELISNVFKHAFPEGHGGELNIALCKSFEKLELIVQDDGIGSTKDIKTSDSFGMRMIKSLARKLEAEVDFSFHKGTRASLLISNYKLTRCAS